MLDHEIAHQLDSLLSLSDLSEIQALFESFVITKNGILDYSAITNGLSEYAWNNKNPNRYAEFVAEAWAEYCNNPQPRETAKQIGKMIEREYVQKLAGQTK